MMTIHIYESQLVKKTDYFTLTATSSKYRSRVAKSILGLSFVQYNLGQVMLKAHPRTKLKGAKFSSSLPLLRSGEINYFFDYVT